MTSDTQHSAPSTQHSDERSARLLALTGQLYLVVLVAYLVGLRITHSQAGKY